MIAKAQKWGNNQSQVHNVRGGHDLTELIGRIPADYEPEAVDWGPPVGNEIW